VINGCANEVNQKISSRSGNTQKEQSWRLLQRKSSTILKEMSVFIVIL
jgi:hypothetical protein